MIINAARNFDILAINLDVLHYFNLLNLFSDLYLVKFLDISAKPFFAISNFVVFTSNDILSTELTE